MHTHDHMYIYLCNRSLLSYIEKIVSTHILKTIYTHTHIYTLHLEDRQYPYIKNYVHIHTHTIYIHTHTHTYTAWIWCIRQKHPRSVASESARLRPRRLRTVSRPSLQPTWRILAARAKCTRGCIQEEIRRRLWDRFQQFVYAVEHACQKVCGFFAQAWRVARCFLFRVCMACMYGMYVCMTCMYV